MSSFSRFLSSRARARLPSPIRALQPLAQIPGMISLGGGVPNPELFPITQLSFKVKGIDAPVTLSPDLLSQALQYSNSYGLPSLLDHWRQILKREHSASPYYRDDAPELSVMATTGSQDAISKAFDMILDPGDSLLLENPTYCGALSSLHPLQPNLVSVQTDSQGLIPEDLSNILRKWNHDSPKPKALYTIPTGQNPSGTTIPRDRRQKIYEIACDHDLLILEDDPYWFLHYREEEQPESFFSMDTEFRVLRFDSLSKVISSGLRMGFVSGPKELVEIMQLDQQVSALHACGVSQAITSELFTQWQEQGFNQHIQSVRTFYQEKRDICDKLARHYLHGLAEWTIPTAGMFMWFHCNGIEDTKSMIETKAREKKVLLVPGEAFRPDRAASSCVRASFSLSTEEQMEEAFKRLKEVVTSQ